MIVMGRMIVAVTLVLVIADVEVKMEEAGAKLAVAVPVAGGVETETADTHDSRYTQDRTGQPGASDHGSAETSHVGTPRRYYRSRPQFPPEFLDGNWLMVERLGNGFQRADVGLHDRQVVTGFRGVAAWVEE